MAFLAAAHAQALVHAALALRGGEVAVRREDGVDLHGDHPRTGGGGLGGSWCCWLAGRRVSIVAAFLTGGAMLVAKSVKAVVEGDAP